MDITAKLLYVAGELEKHAGRKDYKIYHGAFYQALHEVQRLVEKNGYEIGEEEWFRKVTTGPKRPSTGNTNSYILELEKDGKPTRRTVAFQVYCTGPRFELNAYIS